MLGIILQVAFLLFSLSILMNFWRLIKGPDSPDRIPALDTVYINSLALLLLLVCIKIPKRISKQPY